jgi:hypothetical protein
MSYLEEAKRHQKKANAIVYLLEKYSPKPGTSVELRDAIKVQDVNWVKLCLTRGLDDLTLPELRAKAMAKGFTGVYGKTKGELICLLTSSTS